MRRGVLFLIGLCFAAFSSIAHADGVSALHKLLANLAQADKSIPITEKTALVRPTLVRGIYRVETLSGKFIGYTNDAGTIYSDGRNYTLIPTTGSALRPLTDSEMETLRQEVIDNIAYDKLIKVTYGDGGNRSIIMFSALDCGFCQGYEKKLHASAARLNTTLYVLPDMLAHHGPVEEQQGWASIARIWCASNTGSAWQDYWATGRLPTEPAGCSYTAASARDAAGVLRDVLSTVGAKLSATPEFIREDGVVQRITEFEIGPQGKPPTKTVGARWLASVN